MENKIIYSKRINPTELLRSLSLNKEPAFNLNVLKLKDLLEDANVKLGFPIERKVLSNAEILTKVLSFFCENIDLKNPTYPDVQHFISSLNNIRMQIKDSDELAAFNKVADNHKDNKSLMLLKTFFEKYLSSFNDDEIDVISLAHKLIDFISKQNKPVYDEICYFEEDKLSKLEEHLLNILANKVTKISFTSLFTNSSNASNIKSINPRYGTRNEVACVIKDIIDNKYPLDTCQIVLMNTSGYINELFKAKNNLGVNMTFECGLPLNLSDAYKLYTTLNQLEEKYFYDVNGYLNLFSSESLDLEKLGISHPKRVAQILGRMKICFDKGTNKTYVSKLVDVKENHPEEFDLILEKIDREINFNKEVILDEIFHAIDEISKGKSYFIREYTKNNFFDEKLHTSSVDFICKAIDCAESELVPNQLKDSYLRCLDNQFVGFELFDDNSIHVTDINKTLSTSREHIYILGLNSSFWPGNNTEDFLFSDELYEELCGVKNITETSLNDKNIYLKKVIDTYLYLGKDVALSYNAQEIKEVRELNPCSVLLDYAEDFFKEQNLINKERKLSDALTQLKEKCSYYDDELSSLSNIEQIAKDNNDINFEGLKCTQVYSDGVNNKGHKYEDESYSPSTLPKFLKCPLRFYLDNIVGADNTITYDPLRPIAGNRFGDLLHYALEHFIKHTPNANLDEVLKYGSDFYDLYVSIDRSISDDNLEKKPFLNSLENAYKFLKKHFVIEGSQTELDIGSKDEKPKAKIGNIHFHGSIDLVTKDDKENYYIVDYKTGSHIEHIENDPETCIQGLIYAQLYEIIYGIKISKVMFYYTRFNQYIVFEDPCGDEAKKLLLEKVEIFEKALKDLSFDIAFEENQEEVCKYCKYANICKKDDGKEGEVSDE